MNILELAILKKMVGGGGGSGTDNYNDLSNLPQINGETLAGNKTAENLGLQDALTFDSAPTEDSTNPVESGGVYNALAGKQDNLTFDDDPTENSTNPVKSGGVYNALAGKQDNLTFDGVYNASTNKAATESTVTNAIAGLDVSALSVDADETISSISETDGKISVTKQDIAIASNQVVSMAGYTKPSSAPATPAIQQGDTANAAFGKLEYKADVNQTNILYALNDGVKNLCPINNGSLTEAGYLNEDGTAGQVLINPIPSGSYKLVWTLSSTATECGFQLILAQGNASVSANRIQTETKYISNTTGTFTADITIPSGKTVTNLVVYMNKAGSASNVMICRADLYSQDSTYVPYALPNSDLTYLEAEDRAELVELVDSGAKNVYNPSRIDNVPTGLTVTRESDGTTLKINGTYSGTGFAYIDVGTFITDKTGVYYLDVTTTKAMSGDFIIYTNDDHLAGNSSYNYTTNPYTSVAIRIASGQAFNNVTVKILICTKAAFGVSQKFVPYKTDTTKPWALLKSGDDLNDIVSAMEAKNIYVMFATGDTGVSNKPANGIFMVRTTNLGGGAAVQEVTMLTGNDRDKSYVRTFIDNNNWSTWKQTTNV